MRCPYCGESETKVVDSREIEAQTRRRRECIGCSKRFTTYEKVENLGIVVIKKNGAKEPFDREKVKQSVIRACSKRPITVEQIDDMVEQVEFKIKSLKSTEVPSKKIGQEVMRRLVKMDKIAYIRFASVCKQFQDIDEFKEEILKIVEKKGK